MADKTRRRLMIGTLALTGAVGGGVAGYFATPEVTGVVISLAVAGFGLGGALGVLFAGGWRAPKPPQPAVPDPPREPDPEPSDPPPDADPPPPPGGEPGWYPIPDGTRRYFNGELWTTHVWRERRSKPRS